MAITPTKKIADLNLRTSDFTHVYFYKSSSLTSSVTNYDTPDFEFPVVEDSINYALGEVDYEYVKLVNGAIWASKASKGDPDISFQVASNNLDVAKLFGTQITTGVNRTIGGKSTVAIDVSSVVTVEGTLAFVDDSGNAEILPNCSLTAARGKDSVAYWNVKVVPGNTIILTQ